jgi:hypothetical protein
MKQRSLPDPNSRIDAFGWVCVCLAGAPYELGLAHGRLLAHEIEDALRTIRFLANWDTGEDFNTFISAAATQFTSQIDSEYLDEIKGIADGCRSVGVETSFDELLAWNGYLDLMSWWPTKGAIENPTVGFQKWKGRGGHHCSAFIANGQFTRNGMIVVAHNTWDRYAAADCNNIMFDLRPSTGNRIVMQGIPGCISSLTDFWETSAGLVIVETTISNFVGYNAGGAPEFYRSRKACQYANSIDEWCDIFSKNSNAGYANSWLLGDINKKEIARFELGINNVHSLDRTLDGFYSGFNTPFNLKIRNQQCTGEDEEFSDIRKNGARRLRWLQMSKKFHGRIDVTIAKRMIADHYDVYLKRNNPSSRTICGHFELDKAQFGGADSQAPYYPRGSNDGKVADSDMIRELSLWARWGHACGKRFNANAFITQHPQWAWLEGYMRNRPSYPWCAFRAR